MSRMFFLVAFFAIGTSVYAEDSAPAEFAWRDRPLDADMDERASRKRDEAIVKLTRLIDSLDDGPETADLYFRLSELRWAKSRSQRLQAMEGWDRALDAWHQKGANGSEPKLEDSALYRDSESEKAKALELYRTILDSYPNYQRRDEVLYNLASALYESGDSADGVKVFWKLLKTAPRSRFVPDTWLELGEHFFEAYRLSDARQAYQRAIDTSKALETDRDDKARVYSYALYKLAWVEFNAERYPTALAHLKSVVDYAKVERSRAMAKQDRIQLYEESLGDMAAVFAYLDATDDAFEFYNRELGDTKAYPYLIRLARKYHEAGKYQAEIKTLERVNSAYPTAARAPANQVAIVAAHTELDRSEAVRREARRLVDLYAPDSPWWRANASNSEVQREAYGLVEAEMAKLALAQHEIAQSTELKANYELASALYTEYLSKFAESENAYRFGFFRAEILFELGRFEAAAPAYRDVVNADANGEYAKTAAYTELLAWEKVLAGASASKSASSKTATLGSVEQNLVAACDRYVRIAPDDKEAVKVRMKAAQIFAEHDRLDDARGRWDELIDRHPRDPLAEVAMRASFESFGSEKRWGELREYASRLQRRAIAEDKRAAAAIQKTIEAAGFNEILYEREPKVEPREAGELYRAFTQAYPASSYAPQALFNAMLRYREARRFDLAIPTGTELVERYGRPHRAGSTKARKPSPAELRESEDVASLRAKSMFFLAAMYGAVAQPGEAISWYLRYANEFPSGEERDDCLYNAAVLLQEIGDYERARKAFERYLKLASSKADAEPAHWRLGEVLEKLEQWTTAERYYRGLVPNLSTGGKLCARFRAHNARRLGGGSARELRAGWEALVSQWRSLSDAERSTPCSQDAIGAASFYALDSDYRGVIAMKLVGSEREVSRRLVAKLNRVDSLQQGYVEVLSSGSGEYGVAALYRVGRLYQDLAENLSESTCPGRLTDEQCMVYEAELLEQARPLEEKAAEAFNKAVTKGYELRLYNDWLRKSVSALNALEPGRFPPTRKLELISDNPELRAPSARLVR